MIRKIALFICIVTLFAVTVVGYAANPALPGCYIAAPASVNEGATITVTVTCNDVTDAVFGFQLGTSYSGSTATVVTTYTPGDFVTNAVNSVLDGGNALALYAVSRTGLDTATGDFTLGTYTLTADMGLTADGSVSILLPAASFKLSDINGTPLSWRQTTPETTVTITDISQAQLNGNVTVRSDGDVSNLNNIDLVVPGGADYTLATVNAASTVIAIANRQYDAATDGELGVVISATMDSHLTCSTDYTLLDGANDAATAVGTITLNAGDVVTVADSAINIQDATAIGSQISSGTPTGELDVNADGAVNIFDLVHVGRNYNAVEGAC